MTLVALDGLQVLQVTCVRERIDVHHANVVMLVQQVQYEIRADEPGSSGHSVPPRSARLFR